MRKRGYRTGSSAILAAGIILALLAAAVSNCIVQGRNVLYQTLDGRRPRQTHTHMSQFALREEMFQRQADTRVRGWLSIVESEEVFMHTPRGRLFAKLYAPVKDAKDALWAIVVHGGAGTDHEQVLDIACALSLEGYHVLAPDLYAHGKSDGRLASLGTLDSDDVIAWTEWIAQRDLYAEIVVFGQDEGGAAALLAAAKGMPDRVCAVAADSAYVSVQNRMADLLAETDAVWFGRRLLEPAYRLVHGVDLSEGNICEVVADADTPLLIIHGTGDEDILAWQSEDIARAAGERAQLLLVEGAGHGMARFLDPDLYYDTLLCFFADAVNIVR